MSTQTNWVRSLNNAQLTGPGAPSYFRSSAFPGVSFVQANIAEGGAGLATTLSKQYLNAQIAGDCNIVMVGWTTSGITVTIADTSLNTYKLLGTQIASGGSVVSIYGALNIAAAAAGANTVTATFSSTGTTFGALQIMEYGGVDPLYGFESSASALSATASIGAGPITPQFPGLVVTGEYAGQVSVLPLGFTTRNTASLSESYADAPAIPGAAITPTWIFTGVVNSAAVTATVRAKPGPVLSPGGSMLGPMAGVVFFNDKNAQWTVMLKGATGAVINVEVIMPGDNPPANWVILQQITLAATGPAAFSYLGPYLAMRLNWVSGGSAPITGDIMFTEFEWY